MAISQSASSQLTHRHVSSRREWLCGCATFLSGFVLIGARGSAQQLPPGVGMAATPPCDPATTPTPKRTPVPAWRAGAPLRTALSDAADTSKGLTLTGAVIGLRCGLIAGATVDVWHADAKGVSDASGSRFRGRQITDAAGRFHVETIVPGSAAGQAPRVNLRVNVQGRATLTTILFLPELTAGHANRADREFDPLLAMTLIDQKPTRLTASFNVILDL